jgi:two-component system response regulator
MKHLEMTDILLVDDNALDSELAVKALRKQNITNLITVVEDGAEALEWLFGRGQYSNRNINHQPKIILLDLKLPKVSGLDVLKKIKTADCLRTIPVVVLTSSFEDPDIKKAYELGANSYVVKPVGSDAFTETMKKLGLYWLIVNQQPK